MAVHEQLGHGRGHRIDLVLLARQRRDQLRIVESRGCRRQSNLHERHRIWGQLEEGGVPIVDGVGGCHA